MTNLLNKLAPALTALFASALAVSAVPPQPRAGEPLVGLTSSQMQRFQEGRDFYSTPLSIAKGPLPWQTGHTPTSMSALLFWNSGPMVCPHRHSR